MFSKEFLAGNESFIEDKRFHPYRLEKETGFFSYLIKVENWSLRQHPLLSCCPPFCCHRKSLLKTPIFFQSSEGRSLESTPVPDSNWVWWPPISTGIKNSSGKDDLQDFILLPWLGYCDMIMTKGSTTSNQTSMYTSKHNFIFPYTLFYLIKIYNYYMIWEQAHS